MRAVQTPTLVISARAVSTAGSVLAFAKLLAKVWARIYVASLVITGARRAIWAGTHHDLDVRRVELIDDSRTGCLRARLFK